jgi:hypothetical protein
MDFAELIPVAGILGGVAIMWIVYKYQELRVRARAMELDAGEQADEKRQLLQRLAVLERIATDRGLQTAEQIDALREPPYVSAGDTGQPSRLATEIDSLPLDKGGRA